jgi:hypothetical protein
MHEYTENVLIPYAKSVVDEYPLRPHQIDVLFDGIDVLIFADFIFFFKSKKKKKIPVWYFLYILLAVNISGSFYSMVADD